MSGNQSTDKGKRRAMDSPAAPTSSVSRPGNGNASAQGGPFGTIDPFGPYFSTSSPAAMSAPSARVGGSAASAYQQGGFVQPGVGSAGAQGRSFGAISHGPYVFETSSPAATSVPHPRNVAPVTYGPPHPVDAARPSGLAAQFAALAAAASSPYPVQDGLYVSPAPDFLANAPGPSGRVASNSIAAMTSFPSASEIHSASQVPSANPGTGPLVVLPPLKPEDALSFRRPRDALNHISIPDWMPISITHGLPQEGTPEDSIKCIKKVYNSLINLSNVKDATTSPEDFAKFRPGGDWSDRRDLEAGAASIVCTMIRLHSQGQHKTPLWLPGNHRTPMMEDFTFTFHQRLHWVCFLLAQWKSFANRFMCQIALEAHVARIWTLVCMQPEAMEWWLSTSEAVRHDWMEVQPYQHMTSFGLPIAHQDSFDWGVVPPENQTAVVAHVPEDLEMASGQQGFIPSGNVIFDEPDMDLLAEILGVTAQSHGGQTGEEEGREGEGEGA